MTGFALALDVGGSTLAAAIVGAGGEVLASEEVATPVSADATRIAAAVTGLAARLAAAVPTGELAGVGIGSAGPLDPVAGTVSPVNIPAWRDFPLVAEVRAVTGGVPVLLAGDGICMAFGEHWRGGHGGRNLLGMVVSTGVGGGLVIDGAAYPGPTGNAGHIGHIVVRLDGPDCPCGGRGCVEALASGPAMVGWALANGWRPDSTPNRAPDGRLLAKAARGGDPVARQAFERGGRAIAAAVVSAAALVDLDVAVIGGGVAAAGDVLFDPLRAAMADYAVMPFIRRIRVTSSPLGRFAGLLGAAALVFGGTAAHARPDPAALPA
ncbi:MAG: ROK family protein [Labedaea sp.]